MRIWLTFALITLLSSSLALYYVQKTVRPSAKRVVEDSLVDTSVLLSHLVAKDVATLSKDELNQSLNDKLSHAFISPSKPIWYHQKSKSTYHVYITDDTGVVIYDSRRASVGADFSRWNDVYLTLHGKYGARSTNIGGHSVMYVASPIVSDGRIIGVVSVGKPTQTLIPYINKSTDEIIQIILIIMAVTLAAATLMAWWLRRSIDSVNRYTKGLASSPPPHFYLGRELNELMASIHAMKDTIENKAYVSEYVHTLTHELKSPLTAIRASSEILTDELSLAERQQFTGIILSQTDKLTALVDKLLTLAKIEQPSFQPTLQTTKPSKITQDCLQQLAARLQQKQLISHSFGQDEPLLADAFWLEQAIKNLLDNAINHAQNFLLIVHEPNKIHIINDSLVLPDYVLERAFERYFSTSLTSPTTKGTGLGLPLVAQVMHHHQGLAFLQQNTWQDWLTTLDTDTQGQIKAWLENQNISPDHLVIASLAFWVNQD